MALAAVGFPPRRRPAARLCVVADAAEQARGVTDEVLLALRESGLLLRRQVPFVRHGGLRSKKSVGGCTSP